MRKAKRNLSPETAQRLDEHARASAEAMRRATSTRRQNARAPSYQPPDLTGTARQPPKSRRGKKAVVVYLSEEAKQLFAETALAKRMTTQELGALAINLMFEHFRLKPVA